MKWPIVGRLIDGAQNVLQNIPSSALSATGTPSSMTYLRGDFSWATPAGTGGGGSSLAPTAVKTSAYTASASDLVPANATSGAFTVTLPAAPADKTQVAVKKIDPSANAVTIAAAGSDVFNVTSGSTTLSLPLQFQAAVLQYSTTGAIWYVLSTDVPLGGLDARYSPVSVNASNVGPNWLPSAYVSGNYYLTSCQSATTSFASLDGWCHAAPWVVTASITVTRLFIDLVTAGEANSYVRLGIYADDGFGRPGAKVLDAGTISTGSGNAGTVATGGTAGMYEIAVSQALTPGLYWAACAYQNSATTRPTIRNILGSSATQWNMPLGTALPAANSTYIGWVAAGVTGALPSTFGSPIATTLAPRIGFKVS